MIVILSLSNFFALIARYKRIIMSHSSGSRNVVLSKIKLRYRVRIALLLPARGSCGVICISERASGRIDAENQLSAEEVVIAIS
jgi:hypothetical protein